MFPEWVKRHIAEFEDNERRCADPDLRCDHVVCNLIDGPVLDGTAFQIVGKEKSA